MTYEKGRLPVKCPACKKKLDGHITTDGVYANPKKGGIGICYYCHVVFEFQGGTDVKQIDVDELEPEETRKTIKMVLYMVKNKVNNK